MTGSIELSLPGGIAQWLLQGFVDLSLEAKRHTAFWPAVIDTGPRRNVASQIVTFLGPGRAPILAQAARDALTRWTPLVEPDPQHPYKILRELLHLGRAVRPPRIVPVLHELLARRHLFSGPAAADVVFDIVHLACACGASREHDDGDDVLGFLLAIRENHEIWQPEMARLWLRTMVQAGRDLFEHVRLVHADLLALRDQGYDILWFFSVLLDDDVRGLPHVARSLHASIQKTSEFEPFGELLLWLLGDSGLLWIERDASKQLTIGRRDRFPPQETVIESADQIKVINLEQERRKRGDFANRSEQGGKDTEYGSNNEGRLIFPAAIRSTLKQRARRLGVK